MSGELTDFLLKLTFERKYQLIEQQKINHLIDQSCPLSSIEILNHIYYTINTPKNYRHDKSHKLSLSSEETNPQSPFKCNCKKSKCLKLYCQCFARGSFCQNCNCDCCQNTVQFSDVRAKAIDEMMIKTILPFEYKTSSMKGCNCKKTGCIKKYCQCYNQKRLCGQHCKCISCQNCTHEKHQ